MNWSVGNWSVGDWRAHVPGAVASFAAAALWATLAWRTPTSTHHFAPLVAAGLWGYVTRNFRVPEPTLVDRLLMLGGGFAIAAGAQAVLSIAAKLNGPPLFSAVPVPAELVIMAAVGSVVGSGARSLLTHRSAASDSG